ncbi:MAG: hypothetical protein JHC90_03665 [Ilumatobacteraceae bacterium]|nr:hypothetical protein [Ilumatobacteraceae bacterium]
MNQQSMKELTTRIDQHLRNARFIGKIAVDVAQKKIQQCRAASHDSSAKDSNLPTDAVEPSSDLPIENYDALTAKEIVAALKGCSATQLLAIFNYENTHRQRRTILKAASPSNE